MYMLDLLEIMGTAEVFANRDPSFLTNFSKEQLVIYHEAIAKDLIDNDPPYSLEIRRDAYDFRGNKLDYCYALHFGGNFAEMDRDGFDLSDFWRIFDAIKKDAQAVVKPTVYYTKAETPIVSGERVVVRLIEHYRLGQSNGHRATTSHVVAVGENGTTFETKNSMYVLREAPEPYEPMYHPV